MSRETTRWPELASPEVSSILRHVKAERREESDRSAATAMPRETPDGWPSLPGIDMEQARDRLLGDLYLFMSSLRRLINEFADLEGSVLTSQTQLNAAHAQRMHKLKGTAGMLGATVIEQLASRAEAACRSGNLGEASTLSRQVCDELQRLRKSAQDWLAADRLRSGQTASNMEPALDDALLANLVSLLQAQDLAAVDRFDSLATALRHHVGHQAFDNVRDLMDQLRLSDAAAALVKYRS